MAYDKALIAGKLRRWEKYLNNYRLPDWGDIPNFGLYMEQVIDYLKQTIDYLPPELKEEQFITAATINNYVRRELMPEPVKKKYYRVHLAYLLMICTLKQCLSMATLHTMVPTEIPESEVQAIYSAYVAQHRTACRYFVRQVRAGAAKILDHETVSETAVENTGDLITLTAVVSGFARLLAEKLLLLDGKALDDADDLTTL